MTGFNRQSPSNERDMILHTRCALPNHGQAWRTSRRGRRRSLRRRGRSRPHGRQPDARRWRCTPIRAQAGAARQEHERRQGRTTGSRREAPLAQPSWQAPAAPRWCKTESIAQNQRTKSNPPARRKQLTLSGARAHGRQKGHTADGVSYAHVKT